MPGRFETPRQTLRQVSIATAEFMSRLEAGVLGGIPGWPSTIIAVAALLTAIAALLLALR